MKKPGLILLFLISIWIETLAQDSSIKNRLVFKASYSGFALGSGYLTHQTGDLNDAGFLETKKIGQYLVEAGWGVARNIEIGVYMGSGKFPVYSGNEFPAVETGSIYPIFYGFSADFHILPLLLKETTHGFDFYIGERVGGYYLSNSAGSYPEGGGHLDFGIYSGLAYYPARYMGVFGEFGIANGLTWRGNVQPAEYRTWFRVGLAIKLDK